MKPAIMIVGAVAALALPGGAVASQQKPFKGTFTGTVTATPCGVATLCLNGTFVGKARHLGRTTLTKQAVVHLTSEPCPGGTVVTYTQTVTLTAANGDTINLTGEGSACTGGGKSVGSTALVITGGTGRFENAAGTVEERLFHDLATHAETTTLTGTISFP